MLNIPLPSARRLLDRYEANPEAYSDSQADAIREYANRVYGEQEGGEASVLSTIAQFGAGFVEGFTTLQVGKDPDTAVEQIARSVGSVMGFVGFIPGPGVLGKLGTTAFARSLGINRKLASYSRYAANLNPLGPSLPMRVANTVFGIGRQQAVTQKAAAVATKFFRPATAAGTQRALAFGDMVAGGLHLGVASGVASWQQGVDSMMERFAIGTLENFGFRGIANLAVTGSRGANAVIRGLASSAYAGLPSTLRGDPMELQVYEYILGAYFGSTDVPYHQRQAGQFIQEKVFRGRPFLDAEARKSLLDPTRIEGYDTLHESVQEEVLTQAMHSMYRDRTVLGDPDTQYTTAEAARDLAFVKLARMGLDPYAPDAEATAIFDSMESRARSGPSLQNSVDYLKTQVEAGRNLEDAYRELGPMIDKWDAEAQLEIDRLVVPTSMLIDDELAMRDSAYNTETRDGFELKGPLVGPQRRIARAIASEQQQAGDTESVRDIEIRIGRTLAAHHAARTTNGKDQRTGFEEAQQQLADEIGRPLSEQERDGLVQAWHNADPSRRPISKSILFNGKEGTEVRRLTNEELLSMHDDADWGFSSFLENALSTPDGERATLTSMSQYAEASDDPHSRRKPIFGDPDDRGPAPGFKDLAPDRALEATVIMARQGKHLIASKKAKGALWFTDQLLTDVTSRSIAMQRLDSMGWTAEEYSAAEADFVKGVSKHTKDKAEAEDIFARMTFNNVAVLEQMNGGIKLGAMQKANRIPAGQRGHGQFLLGPQQVNTRMQLLLDSGMPLDGSWAGDVPSFTAADGTVRTSGEDGGIRTVFVDDERLSGLTLDGQAIGDIKLWTRDKSGAVVEASDYTNTDGAMVMHPAMFDRLAYAMGVTGSGALKGAVVSGDQKLGLLLNKMAIFRGSDDFAASMNLEGVDGGTDHVHAVVYGSAAKQRGFRQMYGMRVEESDAGREAFFTDHNGATVKPEIYTVPFNDWKMNTSSSEDVLHALGRQVIPKQMHSFIRSPEAMEAFMDLYLRPSIRGDEAETARVMGVFKEEGGDTDFDIGDLSLQSIVDVISSDRRGPVFNKVVAQMTRVVREHTNDGDDLDEMTDRVLEEKSIAPRILAILEGTNDIGPSVMHDTITGPYIDGLLKRYVQDRALRPMTDDAAVGILNPHDMWTRIDLANRATGKGERLRDAEAFRSGEVGDDYILLGQAAKEKTIRWVGGKKMKLGKAFDTFMDAEDGPEKEAMGRLLDFAVTRVPLDSPAGVRMLKFAGFTNRQGAGAVVSNRNMKLMGGADLDIDKVFWFQDIDKASDRTLGETLPSEAEGVSFQSMTPGRSVQIYRGENEQNVAGGVWWTTKRDKAAKFGTVISRRVSTDWLGRRAAIGHGGPDEIVLSDDTAREMSLMTGEIHESALDKRTHTPITDSFRASADARQDPIDPRVTKDPKEGVIRYNGQERQLTDLLSYKFDHQGVRAFSPMAHLEVGKASFLGAQGTLGAAANFARRMGTVYELDRRGQVKLGTLLEDETAVDDLRIAIMNYAADSSKTPMNLGGGSAVARFLTDYMLRVPPRKKGDKREGKERPVVQSLKEVHPILSAHQEVQAVLKRRDPTTGRKHNFGDFIDALASLKTVADDSGIGIGFHDSTWNMAVRELSSLSMDRRTGTWARRDATGVDHLARYLSNPALFKTVSDSVVRLREDAKLWIPKSYPDGDRHHPAKEAEWKGLTPADREDRIGRRTLARNFFSALGRDPSGFTVPGLVYDRIEGVTSLTSEDGRKRIPLNRLLDKDGAQKGTMHEAVYDEHWRIQRDLDDVVSMYALEQSYKKAVQSGVSKEAVLQIHALLGREVRMRRNVNGVITPHVLKGKYEVAEKLAQFGGIIPRIRALNEGTPLMQPEHGVLDDAGKVVFSPDTMARVLADYHTQISTLAGSPELREYADLYLISGIRPQLDSHEALQKRQRAAIGKWNDKTKRWSAFTPEFVAEHQAYRDEALVARKTDPDIHVPSLSEYASSVADEMYQRWAATGRSQSMLMFEGVAPTSIRSWYRMKDRVVGGSVEEWQQRQRAAAERAKRAQPALYEDMAPFVEGYPIDEPSQAVLRSIDSAEAIVKSFEAEDILPADRLRVENAADRLVQIVRRNPVIGRHFDQVYAGMLKDRLGAKPDASHIDEMEFVLEQLDGMMTGSFIDRMIMKQLDQANPRISKLVDFVFPATIGRLHRAVDLQVTDEIRRSIRTKSGGIVTEPVREAYSTFDGMHQFLQAITEQNAGLAADLERKYRDDAFAFMRSLDGEHRADADELTDLSTYLLELGDRTPEAMGEVQSRFRGVRERYDLLKDRSYLVMLDGEQRQRSVTGEQLMGTVRELGDGTMVLDKPGILVTRKREVWQQLYSTLVRNEEAQKAFFIYDDTNGIDPDATVKRILAAYREKGVMPFLGLRGVAELAEEYRIRNHMKTPTGATISERYRDGLRYPDSPDGIDRKTFVRWIRNARQQSEVFMSDHQVPNDYYWTRTNHDKASMRRWFQEYVGDIKSRFGDTVTGADATELATRLHYALREGVLPESLLTDQMRDMTRGSYRMTAPIDEAAQVEMDWLIARPLNSRTTKPMYGWDASLDAISTYVQGAVNQHHKMLGTMLGEIELSRFRERNPFKNRAVTAAWARWGEAQLQAFQGAPSIFNSSWFSKGAKGTAAEGRAAGDVLDLEEHATYWTSDMAVELKAREIDFKFTGGKSFELTDAEKVALGRMTPQERKVAWRKTDVGQTVSSMKFQRRLGQFSMWEARYQMMTLLAQTKAVTNNMFGGNMQTVVNAGFRYWREAGNGQYIADHLGLKNQQEIEAFVEKWGGMEQMLRDEVSFSGRFSSGKHRAFAEDAIRKIKNDPSLADTTLLELAAKHGVDKSFLSTAGAFMRLSERRVRARAFMAHYLKMRDVFAASGSTFDNDDPMLIEAARKGVSNTQFLYNATARPAFARSHLGRVISRFQIWSWNSVRFRRNIYKDAKALGMRDGTPEFERFQRMMGLDLFMFGLASALPFSMFESTLPAPWNYVQDLSDFFFGDEEEKRSAFFGALPYPANIMQPFSPVALSRIYPIIGSLASGDWERFVDYNLWSYIPFGLVARGVTKTAVNPSMVSEYLVGFPLHQAARNLRAAREEEFMDYGMGGD